MILWKTWKTTVARQSRERDRKIPIGILRSSAPRTSEQPGTGWRKSDSEAYNENGLQKVSAAKIISALEAVARRTPAKINSFNYFVKEVVTPEIRATAPGRRNSSRRSSGGSGIVRSAARAIPGSISPRTSNAHAPEKVSRLTTIFSPNWSAEFGMPKIAPARTGACFGECLILQVASPEMALNQRGGRPTSFSLGAWGPALKLRTLRIPLFRQRLLVETVGTRPGVSPPPAAPVEFFRIGWSQEYYFLSNHRP